MTDINAIVGLPDAAIAQDRAVDAWRRIQEKPTSIVIVRGKSETLAAQTVRVEYSSTIRGAEVEGQGGGKSSRQYAVVFGVQGHPTQANTNIQRDDRFNVDGIQYRVNDVLETIGEIQAHAEAYA